MDFGWSDRERAFREEVRAFVGSRWSGLTPDETEGDDAEASRRARAYERALNERGWLTMAWPEEYGGLGAPHFDQLIFAEESAAVGAPAGGQSVQMVGPLLMIHGAEEQKREHLPKIASGEAMWCQGFSEPGAGSDLASLQTRAVRDGDEYVINGQKIWTSNAHNADHMYILVRTDPDAPKHRGISLIVIEDIRASGVQVRPLRDMTFGHHFNETFFEDVRAPVSNRIGEEHRGWYVGMTLLDYERSNIDSAVTDRTLIEELAAYLGGEEGRVRARAGRRPALRAEIADRYVECDVARNFGMRIASLQAAGAVPNHEASAGKMFGTETHQRVLRTGVKALGLYGNVWGKDSPYAPMRSQFTHGYVRSVPSTIAGGSSEIQRNIIATRGLGLPRG